MVCYELILYGVYMAAVAIAGLGLWTGLFSGEAPFALTLLPAIFATAVIVIVVSMLFVDEPASPPCAVLVMGYYLGTLGSALPLPGGVGGVEGGMIAAFIAFGASSHVAVPAVLGYRTISYWLPTIPGAIAYLRLRHRLDAPEPAPS